MISDLLEAVGLVVCMGLGIVFVWSYVVMWLKVDHLVTKLCPPDDEKSNMP